MTVLPIFVFLFISAQSPPSPRIQAFPQEQATAGEPATTTSPGQPPRPGASQVSYEGCFASKDRQAQIANRSLPDFDLPPPSVHIDPFPGGLLVVDEREHNCCAEPAVTAKIRGRTVEIREVLTGQRCRCQCRSTIRTTVGVRPGKRTVILTIEEYGKKKTAFKGEIVVPPR